MLPDAGMVECKRLMAVFGGDQRPPMTFEQQAELIEWLLGRFEPHGTGRTVMLSMPADSPQLADLSLTAYRLRRMAPHEDQIRHVVMGS